MSAPKVMALRFTTDVHDGVSLDLGPRNKFSVSHVTSESYRNPPSTDASVESSKEFSADSDSSADQVPTRPPSPEDVEVGEADPPDASASENTSIPPSFNVPNPRASSIAAKAAPPFSRSLSMPLPSRLAQLQNPHRSGKFNSYPPSSSSQVDEVSVELADSIQLVIQTLLQVSPPQVLDTAKEQFSACALSVPTPSMSALFTAMKNINYISAHMSSLCDNSRREHSQESTSKHHNEFDIGEMLQCIGDALSGAAAQTGVDLVIYHGDTGLKHVYVSGDESAISFALSHVIRQILNTAEKGDSIELGLFVSPAAASHSQSEDELPAATEENDLLQITIRISHRYSPSDPSQGNGHPNATVAEVRSKPHFSTLLFRRILRQIGGNLKSDLPPPESFSSGSTCDFELVLERLTTPPGEVLEQDHPTEPTLEQLASFGEALKGKRVTFYASEKGSFAHHLTSYLTDWGMDVTHVSPDGQVDGSTETALQPSSVADNSSAGGGSTNTEPRLGGPELIFIDDDVDILKERLQMLRLENQSQLSIPTPRKRPSLSANQRTRSSQQVARLVNVRSPTVVVILHFTCLSNYKRVKDVVQSIVVSYGSLALPLPEVMIIPKPVGPRRFLTALHTAITKPTVDPFFMPIATSPISPGGVFALPSSSSMITSTVGDAAANQLAISNSQGSSTGILPSQSQSSLGRNGTRPHNSRTNSERSIMSLDGPGGLTSTLPPSPLVLPDNVEYFSANAQKLGNSPSSGLVIQSPDGQTAGIFFHPRSKNSSRNPSSYCIDRERGQTGTPGSRRQSTSRMSTPNKEDTMSFSSLYQGPQKNALSPNMPVTIPDIVSVDPDVSVSPPTVVPSTAVQSPSDNVTTPVPEDHPTNSPTPSPSSARPPNSRTASDDSRTLSSPAPVLAEGSHPTPSRRGLHKKTASSDNKDPSSMSAKQKGKMSTSADANVVPPISVLIVDDNPINQTILSTFMRRKKIKYDLASNGQEAVQKWRTGGYHLILMDIQMPIMDGIQATKEIRRLEKLSTDAGYPPIPPSPEGQTPSDISSTSSGTGSFSGSQAPNSPYRSSVIIVALTASSLQSDRVAALAAGCNDFLTKPVSLLWLNNKIIEWGSIKALQMWADIRPEAVRTMANGQAQQAKVVAERLHVPKGRVTPLQAKRSTSTMDENAAALALASSAGPIPNLPGTSGMNPSSSSGSGPSVVPVYNSTGTPLRQGEDLDPSGLERSVDGEERPKVKNPKPLQSDILWRLTSRSATPVRPRAATPDTTPSESVNIRDGSIVGQPPP